MILPTVYTENILGMETGSLAEGTGLFSPTPALVGFIPFVETEDRDCLGFYWPLGREERPPLMAWCSYGAYVLVPVHGDLVSAARCNVARSAERELSEELAAALAAIGEPIPEIDITGVVASDDHRQLSILDPGSPFHHCALADQEIAHERFESAEAHYRQAIALLPEYGAAHYGLGYLLRRLRRHDEALWSLRMALMCPTVFWGGSWWAEHVLPGNFRDDWARKTLEWLQRTKQPPPSLADDPFFQQIDHLIHGTGDAAGHDLELLKPLIADYLQLGQPLDAVYLWLKIGGLAAFESPAFRERHDLTEAAFGKRLAELFRLAGLDRRAALLDNLLACRFSL